jgi:predicted enzyme related to lactoylglutathione lyase
MTIKNALAGVAVMDLDSAIAWYSKLIGRAPDQQPMPTDAEYEFQNGGWMQIFADKERAGKSSVTLTVDDLDATLAELEDAGIAYAEPTRTDYVDTAIVTDPDGNQVVLAQARSPDNRAAR